MRQGRPKNLVKTAEMVANLQIGCSVPGCSKHLAALALSPSHLVWGAGAVVPREGN